MFLTVVNQRILCQSQASTHLFFLQPNVVMR